MPIRWSWLLPVALALIAVAPAAAQDTSPGVVIVGHGPDVPNAPASSACEATSPDDVNCEPAPAQDFAPVVPMVVVVPVPVLVPIPTHHHRVQGAPAATQEFAEPKPPENPFGRFINDPSRQFINPTIRPSGG